MLYIADTICKSRTVTGTVTAWNMLTITISFNHHSIPGRGIIIIMQLGKLSHQEVKQLAQVTQQISGGPVLNP